MHTLGELEKLVQSVTPEIRAGLPHIAPAFAKLQSCVERIHQLMVERNFHEARKQEATREIRERLEEGRKDATAVRAGLKVEMGDTNEALVRFGIQPFRGRKRRKKADETPDENGPEPAAGSSA